MPKNALKKFFPSPQAVKEHPSLQFLGKLLHEPNLWHMNRRSVSRAFMVGLFCAFLPMPFQMVVATVIGIWARSNLPISIGLVWLTNPITMPPIFYFTYLIGTWILGAPDHPIEVELSVEWFTAELANIWQPLLLGSMLCAVIFAVLGYAGIRLAWRIHVVRAWRKRQAARQTEQKQ